jgi:hypothetical protein
MISTQDDPTKKRKLDLEDLELAERRVTLKEREIAAESKKMHAPLELLKTCTGVVGSWEDRDMVKIRAMLMNQMDTYFRNTSGATGLIESSGAAQTAQEVPKFVTISEVANEMGERGLSSDDLKTIGRLTSKAYQEKFGAPPSKHRMRLGNGQEVDVCDYQDIHAPLIHKAISDHKAELAKKAQQAKAQPVISGYFQLSNPGN